MWALHFVGSCSPNSTIFNEAMRGGDLIPSTQHDRENKLRICIFIGNYATMGY